LGKTAKWHKPPQTLTCEDLWKAEVVEEFSKLLEQDCAEFFRSQNDPLAAGVASLSPCIFCEGNDFSFLFRQQAYSWVRCRSCGLLQKRPRPTFQATKKFNRHGKAVAFWENRVLRPDRGIRQEKIFNPYLARLAKLAQKYSLAQGGLLDIGCAGGSFLAAAQEQGLFSSYVGVEPNASNATEARRLGFEVYQGMFEEAEIPAESFDVITCFSLIQFVHGPMDFLRKCKSLLRTGGFMAFTSPNGWAPDILLLGELSPVLPCHTLQLLDPESFAYACAKVGLSEVYAEATGQLDVQLVRETWQDYPPDRSQPWGDFLYRLFVERDSGKFAKELQTFLRHHNLSGHLWLQARNI
jgi:2-polyprenyl-3-methyl-5-hydroxy-6-metoxy-1,4-benzoquinol methylase